MDRTCKSIIKYLKTQPDHSLMYYDEPDIMKNEMIFYDAVRYMEKLGYLEYISNQDGYHLGIHLSHTGDNILHYTFAHIRDEFIRSVALPIIVAIVTTLVVNWLL